jgi:alpha-beta hydrolase superfamily lysophospholipase
MRNRALGTAHARGRIMAMAFRFIRIAAALAAMTTAASAATAQTATQFKAADGVTVFANTYQSSTGARGAILLFHQAGASKSEYASIAPRLAAQGFDVTAIDQRSGVGGNQTVAALGRSTDYAAALPDLEAALAYAKGRAPGGRVIVWGSSYSAALVFLLAAKHPSDIAAVLAFSPGEYIRGQSVRGAAAQIAAPVFVTSASAAGEIAAAKAIAGAVRSGRATQFEPRQGAHGSSTLSKDANLSGFAENWAAVDGFLKQVAP